MTAFNGDPCSSRQRPSGWMDTGKVRRLRRDTAEDKRINHGCWTSPASNIELKASKMLCLTIHTYLPQRWRPWWRLLCSPDECSPLHTLLPAPPAPCNPWHHSADTQSWKRGTKRWREFHYHCYQNKCFLDKQESSKVKTVLNRWQSNIFLLCPEKNSSEKNVSETLIIKITKTRYAVPEQAGHLCVCLH